MTGLVEIVDTGIIDKLSNKFMQAGIKGIDGMEGHVCVPAWVSQMVVDYAKLIGKKDTG